MKKQWKVKNEKGEQYIKKYFKNKQLITFGFKRMFVFVLL